MRSVLLVAALIGALLCAQPALAAEPTTPVIVLVTAAPEDGRTAAILARLAEIGVLVATEPGPAGGDRAHASERARRLADAHAALGTFWFSDEAEGPVLYLFDRRRRRVLARRLAAGGTEVAATEEAAIIVRSTVSALLEGSQVAMEVVEVVPPPPPSPPARAAPSRALPSRAPRGRLRLAVAAVVEPFVHGQRWQLGEALGVALAPVDGWYAGVGYVLLPALNPTHAGASIRLVRHPAEVVIGFEHAVPHWVAGGEASLVLDRLERATTGVPSDLRPTPERAAWIVAVGARARGAWLPLPRLRLYAAAGAEWLARDVEYLIVQPERTSAISLIRLRPRFDAGVAVAIW